MPNATVRANARALPEATNRRAVLRGVLIAGAAIATPAGTSAATDDLANRLWARRHALRQPYIDAWDAIHRAQGQLPEWVSLGPRFSKRELKDRYRLDLVSRPETALEDYKRGRQELAQYWRAVRAERAKLGLPGLELARGRISDQREAIQEEIEELEPNTSNAAAARILLEVATMSYFGEVGFFNNEGPIAEVALRFLRPSLTGLIRSHVDEVFDNPDLPAGMLQATSPHRASYEEERSWDVTLA